MSKYLIVLLIIFPALRAHTQRTYTDRSVLADGKWYKIAIRGEGVYKVDGVFLKNLGINLPVPATSVRLFGNGGRPLPENNGVARPDDLIENAIQVNDGGDGNFDAGDYFLFYAPGPNLVFYDSAEQSFRHKLNIYSNKAYYFITTEGNGKRISQVEPSGNPNLTITTFDEFLYHELDTVNFLSSGQEWYGEEFSDGPGRTLSREFNFSVPGLITNEPVKVTADLIGRSTGQNSRFDLRLNNSLMFQQDLPPLAGTAFDPVATSGKQSATTLLSLPSLILDLQYTPGSVNGQGWLNWIEVECRRALDLQGIPQLVFRDTRSIGAANLGEFIFQNATNNTRVWEISDPLNPTQYSLLPTGNQYHFLNDCSRLRTYIAFDGQSFFQPESAGTVSNQNLHEFRQPQMIIVTHETLLGEAKRLAEHHAQKDGLTYIVSNVKDVFNEFGSGSPDPAAIRDYVKMFYDRAGSDSTKRPRYLLLFGDASFDYKDRIEGNTNLVPCYESPFSLQILTSYTSDDFFGLLDDQDDINVLSPVPLLDIGIGRIPAKNPVQARSMVDKIIHYAESKSLGPWRNQMSFTADDEDFNVHLNDAETITKTVSTVAPDFNISKVYLDAYRQESGTGGNRYPLVNQSINNRIYNGTLIWNYNGHGGHRQLAEEVILEEDMVKSWNNPDKLPLFITATCDFAPYDDPLLNSLGEQILFRDKSGAIALMTTTRLVFAFSNRIMNNNYLAVALQRQADGKFLSLGEAVKRSKNFTYQTSGDLLNNRKFTLLGDPALTIGYPLYHVKTIAVNGVPLSQAADTLKALNRYTISGEVNDLAGNLIQDFNGNVYPAIFDKTQLTQTLGNDPNSIITTFKTQQNLVYNGKVKAQNGKFSFTFIVPKDINYEVGNGRVSYYADNGTIDANGITEEILVGGIGNGVSDDRQGPKIKAYLNDEKFVNGSITNETPVLIIKLTDSSGINTVGTGIGHSITAILDNNSQQTFVLNDFYEAELDSYQQGMVRFQLPALEEGPHSLKIKAWDVFNNSNEYFLEFRVVKKEELELDHVLNYPNPFTTHTSFWFEHNRPFEPLLVSVQIMTVTGKVVKTMRKTIISTGNRSNELEWDGRDDYGDRLGRGVYIYRLSVQTQEGKRKEKIEKLVIL